LAALAEDEDLEPDPDVALSPPDFPSPFELADLVAGESDDPDDDSDDAEDDDLAAVRLSVL
jgi:hypothetical protein